MRKRSISIIIVFIMLMTFPVHGAINTGVDRSKIKAPISESYPVFLRIGKLSFEGKLARMSEITEEDIKKAIQEALKEVGKTEAEIGEAEALVKKVARDNTFTEEDSKRVGKEIRDFILKQTNLDTPLEIIQHVIGVNDRSLDEFIIDKLEGAATDKAASMLLGELGGPVTQIVEGLMFLSEKYEQDKQKWKNRADAVNANRMLQNFYSRINNKIEKIAKQRQQGWAISMNEATDSRYFSFFGIPGNLEIWTIDMILKKSDNKIDKWINGTYEGVIDIDIKYEMSKFDEGIKDKYQDWIDDLYKDANQELGFKWMYKEGGTPTKINRKLVKLDFSVPISNANKIFLTKNIPLVVYFFGIEDYKEIEINRKIERTLNHFHEGVYWEAKSTMTFNANNEEKLIYSYTPQYFNVGMDGYKAAVPENKVTGEVPWDLSIWESWEGLKELEIIFK